MKPITIFLDMDGVLADFDRGAGAILGTDNTYKWEFVHGTNEFWRRLDAYPNFFGSLPPMPDMRELWDAVNGAGTNIDVAVLTALPKAGAELVAHQKREWVRRHIPPPCPVVITCLTHEKPSFCDPGDVLVDDRTVNRAEWEKRGGRFIHHTSATSTVLQLRGLGII